MRRRLIAALAALVVSAVGVGLAVSIASGDQPASGRTTTTATTVTAPPPTRSVVLGDGPIGDRRFQVTARSSANADRGTPCIFLTVSGLGGAERGNGAAGDCLTRDYRRLVKHGFSPSSYGARRELLPQGQLVMQGLIAKRVKRMRLRWVDTSGRLHHTQMHLFRLTHQQSRRLGRHETGQFFVAFVPAGLFPKVTGQPRPMTEELARSVFSSMRIKAFDLDGGVVLSRNLAPSRFSRLLFLIPPVGYTGAP